MVKVIRAVTGPRGVPAGQDVGWILSGGFNPGEMLNSPPLARATIFSMIYAHTDSGVFSPQTLTIHQRRAGTTIATTTIGLSPGLNDFQASIGGSGLSCSPGDYFQLVMPNPIDTDLIDITLTLGSTP